MVVLIAIGVSGCPHPNGPFPDEFTRYLEDNGYALIPLPSRLERGGSLVYIKDKGGEKQIEWVDDLIECGVPEDIVYGDTDEARERALNGGFPGFEGRRTVDLGANAALSIKGVEPGVGFDIIRKTEFDMQQSGHETIRRLRVAHFLADPLQRRSMKSECIEAVVTQRTAVLYDVAYIEKGTASFFKGTGGEVRLKGPELLNALKVDNLEADARAKLENEGVMEIDDRIYIAFKEAFFVPETGTLATPGPIRLEDATPALIEASRAQ
jgi:hypothetical protein